MQNFQNGKVTLFDLEGRSKLELKVNRSLGGSVSVGLLAFLS